MGDVLGVLGHLVLKFLRFRVCCPAHPPGVLKLARPGLHVLVVARRLLFELIQLDAVQLELAVDGRDVGVHLVRLPDEVRHVVLNFHRVVVRVAEFGVHSPKVVDLVLEVSDRG